jgi:hypothetical protein
MTGARPDASRLAAARHASRPASQRQAADAGVHERARRSRKRVRGRGRLQVHQPRPRERLRRACDGIDDGTTPMREVVEERAVGRRVSGHAVATASDADGEVDLDGRPDGRHDVWQVDRAEDMGGLAIGQCVVRGASWLVAVQCRTPNAGVSSWIARAPTRSTVRAAARNVATTVPSSHIATPGMERRAERGRRTGAAVPQHDAHGPAVPWPTSTGTWRTRTEAGPGPASQAWTCSSTGWHGRATAGASPDLGTTADGRR